MFLVAGRSPSRDKDRGNQVPGLWVNHAGELRPETSSEKGGSIMRWSFRKTLDMAPWKSDYPHGTIQDGDEVYLFCHSLMMGLFRDPEVPPRVASPVCWSDKHPNQVKAFSPAMYWWFAEMYDQNQLDQLNSTDRDLVVPTAGLVGNAVAEEARVDRPGEGSAAWLGAFDKDAGPRRSSTASMFGGDVLTWKLLDRYAGMGTTTSDMLARMAKEGFEPARFRVRFVNK